MHRNECMDLGSSAITPSSLETMSVLFSPTPVYVTLFIGYFFPTRFHFFRSASHQWALLAEHHILLSQRSTPTFPSLDSPFFLLDTAVAHQSHIPPQLHQNYVPAFSSYFGSGVSSHETRTSSVLCFVFFLGGFVRLVIWKEGIREFVAA